MPFYPPEISPDVSRWKMGNTPRAQGLHHKLDAQEDIRDNGVAIMGWADELYENEPGLAPYNEKGAHAISLLAKLLGLGGALEGNWKGQAEGTHSPMWGTGSGAKTGYAFDAIPVPIAKSEAPMAAILGSVPWPVAGAMEATGRIPTAWAAAKSQKALAESGTPYAAIGKQLQDASGVGENAWNLGKEGLESLLQKLRGLVPEGMGGMEPAMQAARPSEAGQYGSIMDRLLGKHQIYAPYIPQSVEEPLLLKTGATTTGSIKEALPEIFQEATPDLGFYKPLWDTLSGRKGDIMGSTIASQGTSIPHEGTHYFTDLLTDYISKGHRPWDMKAIPRAAYGHEPERLETAAQHFWDNWGTGEAWPGGPTNQTEMRRMWSYGDYDPYMKHELTAELTNPQGLAERFKKPIEWAERLKGSAKQGYPELRDLWSQVENYIPEGAYDIPVWNQRLLGTTGQGATQGTARWSE